MGQSQHCSYDEGPAALVFPATTQEIWAASSPAGPVLHCLNGVHHHIVPAPSGLALHVRMPKYKLQRTVRCAEKIMA